MSLGGGAARLLLGTWAVSPVSTYLEQEGASAEWNKHEEQESLNKEAHLTDTMPPLTRVPGSSTALALLLPHDRGADRRDPGSKVSPN